MLELNWWQFLFNIINILILYFILKRFLFGPITNIMEKRDKLISDSVTEAEDNLKSAENKKVEYENILSNAHGDANEIITKASVKAQKVSDDIINNAKAEAEKIVLDAKETAKQEGEAIIKGIQDDIANLAILAASKVLDKNVDNSSNKGIVDDFLKEVGAA